MLSLTRRLENEAILTQRDLTTNDQERTLFLMAASMNFKNILDDCATKALSWFMIDSTRPVARSLIHVTNYDTAAAEGKPTELIPLEVLQI